MNEKLGGIRDALASLAARSAASTELHAEEALGNVGGVPIPKDVKRRSGLLNLGEHEGLHKVAPAMAGAAQLGLGIGMTKSYAPWARSSFGLGTVSHGTRADNAADILRTGLQLEHAGKAKRMNSIMMREALVDYMEELLGTSPGREAFERLGKVTSKGRGYAENLVDEALAILNEQGKAVSADDVRKALTARGRRIYFGGTPSAVYDWGREGGDLAVAAARALDRAPASTLDKVKGHAATAGDMFSGGAVSTVEEVTDDVRFRRAAAKAQKQLVTRKQAIKILDELKGQGKQVVFDLPASALDNVAAFSDFPVVGPVVGSHKGVQRVVRNAGVVNYTPGRDLSVAHGVDPRNVKRVYVGSAGSPVEQVLDISDYAHTAPAAAGGTRWARFKNKAFPVAMTALGADLALRGLRGRGLYGSAKDLVDYVSPQGSEKQGHEKLAISRGLARGLRGAGIGAAIPAALLAPMAVSAAMPTPDPVTAGADAAATGVGSMGGLFGGLKLDVAMSPGSLDTVDGVDVDPQFVPKFMSKAVGGQVGAVHPQALIGGQQQKLQAKLTGSKSDPLLSFIPSERLNAYMLRHPEAAPLIGFGTIAGGGAAAGYALNRYYPYTAESIGRNVRQMAQHVKDKAAALGPGAWKTLAKSGLKGYGLSAIGGLGALLGTRYLLSGVRDTVNEKKDEALHKARIAYFEQRNRPDLLKQYLAARKKGS